MHLVAELRYFKNREEENVYVESYGESEYYP